MSETPRAQCRCGHSQMMHPFGLSENLAYTGTCMSCDCKEFDKVETPRATQDVETTRDRDVNRAWREGATLAGRAQPMPSIKERWAGRSSSEIAAFEMGYAFIHNSEVAKEMAGRIHRVAERAAKAETELSSLRSQVETVRGEIRMLAIVAGQASLKGPRDEAAAIVAERCSRWADLLSAALGKDSQ